MEEIINNIQLLFESNNWKDILQLQIDHLNDEVHGILWVWPSLSDLYFIKEIVLRYKLNGIISIGCGSGLFEWLLQESTGLKVTGIEVDELWWKSKYAKHKFIPLKFTKMPPNENLLCSNEGLLFCYFNHGTSFKEYIRIYKGSVVFIIGPGPGRGTLTNPEPFEADFGSSDWKLIESQEIRNTKDFIAVYNRINSSIIPIDREFVKGAKVQK